MVTLITSLYIFFKVATCQLFVFIDKIIIKSTLFDTIVILAIHDLFATYDDAQVYGVGLFALLACTSLMISPPFLFSFQLLLKGFPREVVLVGVCGLGSGVEEIFRVPETRGLAPERKQSTCI